MTVADRLLGHLSRRTTSGQFIPEIDGLRFVSIAMVVCFHLGGYTMAKSTAIRFANPLDNALAHLLATGHYGVQLFFIISGLVLALPFARHHLTGTPAAAAARVLPPPPHPPRAAVHHRDDAHLRRGHDVLRCLGALAVAAPLG